MNRLNNTVSCTWVYAGKLFRAMIVRINEFELVCMHE